MMATLPYARSDEVVVVVLAACSRLVLVAIYVEDFRHTPPIWRERICSYRAVSDTSAIIPSPAVITCRTSSRYRCAPVFASGRFGHQRAAPMVVRAHPPSG